MFFNIRQIDSNRGFAGFIPMRFNFLYLYSRDGSSAHTLLLAKCLNAFSMSMAIPYHFRLHSPCLCIFRITSGCISHVYGFSLSLPVAFSMSMPIPYYLITCGCILDVYVYSLSRPVASPMYMPIPYHFRLHSPCLCTFLITSGCSLAFRTRPEICSCDFKPWTEYPCDPQFITIVLFLISNQSNLKMIYYL